MVLRQAVGDLNRMRQILQVIVKHGFGDLLDRARIFERLRIRKPKTEEDRAHSPAQRFTLLLTELGPTFIKMGQLLSCRPDILPAEYITALSVLQDQAPPFPYAQVVKIIKKDLGQKPEDLFSAFEKEPMASASIAQVHRAVTKDGQDVVVKVKRPDIELTVRSSLDILYYLAHLLEAVAEEGALYAPTEVIKEFDRAIGFEMDLAREAQNLRSFAKNFHGRNNLVIPEPLDDLSGRNVLTMRRIKGLRIDQVEPGSDLAQKAAMNLIEGFFQQVFEDGRFHADPHPGNLLVLDDGRMGLLDFGQTGTLASAQRSTIVQLSLGIILKDADTVARLVYRIGSHSKRADLGKLKQDVEATLESTLEGKLDQIDTSQVLQKLLDLSWQHQVRIPPEFTLATKAMVTIEGVVRMLHPELDLANMAAPYVKRLMTERYSLDDLKGGAGRALLQLTNILNEVPQQMSQILMDLEGGRLCIQARDPEANLLRRSVRGIGMDVFWGLIAAGLLGGSLPALMSGDPIPTAALVGLGGTLLIAVTVTLRYFLAPAIRKLRLRSWLERRWDDKDPKC